VPCGEIKSVGEACEAAQLTERDVVRRIAHPAAGEVRLVVSPLRFADRAQGDIAPPPRLGEHTAPVLAEWLGLGPEEIARAAAAGAFGTAARQGQTRGDT
jgi:formyl-CoA transferase